MNANYARVAERAAHRCEYCRAPEAIFNFSFEVEHVIPVARQGADSETNLALACRACNLHKSDHLNGIDETTQTEVRLFHPRADRWEEHFQVEVESGTISGLTAVGRATTARLNMNSSPQREARLLWIRLGLFP
jgi:HNH endonuclease